MPRKTLALTPLVLTTAALAQPLPPTEPNSYAVTRINPLPGHSSVTLVALNNRGEAIGVSYGSPITNQQPFIYRPGANGAPGVVTPIPFPAGKTFSVPMDINDAGQVVGYAQPTWTDEQGMTPWLWESTTGAYTFFPSRGVATLNNINNTGQFVGRSCVGVTTFTCYFTGTVGSSATTTFGSANDYTSSQWRFIDVNDGGQILYTPPQPAAGVIRNPDGAALSLPASTEGFPRTYTWAINNSGQALARYERNVGSQYYSKAFVWSPTNGQRFVGTPNNFVFPRGMNNLGQVVGESGTNRTSVIDLWLNMPDGTNINLRTLPDQSQGEPFFLSGVRGINDRGEIIAHAFTPTSDFAVILSPPATQPPTCPADLGSTGGQAGPDGTLDNNDFVVFIDFFFTGNPSADLGATGGVPGSDGQFDNNDFIVYINNFFTGC